MHTTKNTASALVTHPFKSKKGRFQVPPLGPKKHWQLCEITNASAVYFYYVYGILGLFIFFNVTLSTYFEQGICCICLKGTCRNKVTPIKKYRDEDCDVTKRYKYIDKGLVVKTGWEQ